MLIFTARFGLFQFSIYRHVKELFPERPWLDVVSKADLLEEPPVEIPVEEAESYMLAGPAGSLRVSVQTERGLDEVLSQPSRKPVLPLPYALLSYTSRVCLRYYHIELFINHSSASVSINAILCNCDACAVGAKSPRASFRTFQNAL